jgi:hypothetical protein
MIEEREKMFCPRLGDSFTKTAQVSAILDGILPARIYITIIFLNINIFDSINKLFLSDVAAKALIKCATKKANTVNLSSLKLTCLPAISGFVSELQALTDINLSKNHLFNSEDLFQVTDN